MIPENHPRQGKSRLKARLLALLSFVDGQDQDKGVFDSDSFPIAVDNCASFTMTNDEKDFVDTPSTVHKSILGIGRTKALKKGIVRWNVEDDQGQVETFELPDTLLVPNLPTRLLSPQHWAQTNNHIQAHSDTNAHRITLEWND